MTDSTSAQTYTLSEIRNGTGFPSDVRFAVVQTRRVHADNTPCAGERCAWVRGVHHVTKHVPVAPKVQLLHYRDPDAHCTLEVWLDGVKINSFEEEDIDPGAGYEMTHWLEGMDTARQDRSDYGKAVHEAFVTSWDSEFTSDKDIADDICPACGYDRVAHVSWEWPLGDEYAFGDDCQQEPKMAGADRSGRTADEWRTHAE